MEKIEYLYCRMFQLGCLKFGRFTLKSGLVSPFYVDLRVLVSDPALLRDIGDELAVRFDDPDVLDFDRIAGIPYAGIPIAQAMSFSSDTPMIYPRKEIKEYGTRRQIEGLFVPGETVVAVDDIITDGASKFEAIEPLIAADLKVTDVVVVLDREQGGKKILAKAGYNLHSLCTISEVLDVLVREGHVEPKMKIKVAEFIAANQFV